MLRVLVGNQEADYRLITRSGKGGSLEWVVPEDSAVGDEAVLFVPTHGFVARAEVSTPPRAGMFGKRHAYRADLDNVSCLPTSVPLAYIGHRLPAWGWVRMKMKGPHTPDPEVARLLGQTLDEYQAELEPEPQERAFEEGRPQHFRATQYERNPAARIACIEHYGPQCAACGLSFGSAYGPMMEGFILVHHLELISASRDRHSVNPTRDMRPVCANCHAVMHRRTPPFTVIEVKRMLRESVRTETKQPVAMEVSARSRRRRTKGGHGDGR